jgi:hypothetical protein
VEDCHQLSKQRIWKNLAGRFTCKKGFKFQIICVRGIEVNSRGIYNNVMPDN